MCMYLHLLLYLLCVFLYSELNLLTYLLTISVYAAMSW